MTKNVLLFAMAVALASGCGEIRLADSDSDDGGLNQGMAIDLVSPPSGPISGGTSVTLIGSGFDGDGASVLIGGRRALDVEVVNKNTLTFRTPSVEEPGLVEIRVFSSNGFGALSDAFEYAQLSRIDSIDPRFGPPEGGNTVTVSGAGFVDGRPGQTELLVDGSPYPATVVDDSTLSFVAPAGEAFTAHDIAFSNRNGAGELPGAYGYILPGLLAADGQSRVGHLYHINPDTAEATLLRSLPRPVSGLLTRANGQVLASGNAPGGISEIGLFDDTFVDIVTTASPVPDLAETEDGKIIGVFRQQRVSVLFDLEADAKGPFQGPIATFTNISGCGIAASPGGKIFFAGQSASGALQSFNGDTLVDEAVLDSPTSEPIMAMSFFGGKLYAIRRGNPVSLPPPGGGGQRGGTLVTINPATGEITEIGALPPNIDALANMPGSE